MVKKLFALASVTALTGLVSAVGIAGCSSDDNAVGSSQDAGAPDVKKDSKGPIVVGDEEPVDNTPDCANSQGAAFQLDTKYKYTSPGAKQPNSCTKDQIDAAVAAIKTVSDKGVSVNVDTDVAPHVDGDAGGTCSACIKGSNTAWRVSNQTTSPQDPYYYNLHGCLQLKGAIDAACADALYTLDLCINFVCVQTCTGNAAINTCAQWAQTDGDCKDIDVSACTFVKDGKSRTDIENETGCGDEANIIAAFCGEET